MVSEGQTGITLDYAESLTLSHQDAARAGNELAACHSLAVGLVYLSVQVARAEDLIADRLGWKPGDVVSVFGRHPAFEGLSQGLLSSYFLWYAVSVCNYARLASWLTHRADSREAMQYVRRVVPAEVVEYRNKVAAHFALVDPRPEDTEADLQASVVLPITFLNGRLVARGFRIAMSHEGRGGTSADLMWSVTDLHERLSERYRWHTPPPRDKPALPPLHRP